MRGILLSLVIVGTMIFITLQGMASNGQNLYAPSAPQRLDYGTWNDGNDEYIMNGVFVSNSLILGGYGHNHNDALLLKYDTSGNLLWHKYLDFGGTKESINSLTVDDDGNIVVTGNTNNGNNGDMVIAKLDLNGNVIWEKTYDSGSTDQGRDVIYDSSDSTYVVVGEGKFEDSYIWKYDKNGNQLWVKDIAPPGFNYDILDYIIKVGNDYYVYGYGDNTTTYTKDCFIEEVNTNGKVISTISVGTTQYDDRPTGLVYMDNYLYAATSVDMEYTKLYKFATDGTEIWTKDIQEDYKTLLHPSEENNTILLDGFVEDSSGNTKVNMVEFDESGNALWWFNDTVTNKDYIQNQAIWENNYTFYVAGNTTNASDGTQDALWVRYSWISNDNISPTVNIQSPTENAITNSTVELKWTGSDNVGIEHYEISDGGSKWINVGTSNNYTFTSLSGGEHTLYVKAYDYSGNTGMDEVNITVDNQPPQISITTPQDGSFQNQNVYMKWNASDNTGIDHYEVSDGGSTWINVGTTTHYTFTGLTQGKHTLYLKAYDIVNNTAEESVNITVDNYIPKVYIITPNNGIWLNTSDVNVVWAGSDDNGIDHYEVSSNGSSWINVGLKTNYEFKNLKEGENVLYVKAVDVAGNAGISYVKVNIDQTPPTGSIISPTSQYISNRNVTLKWSMEDNWGVKDCQVSSGQYWIDVGISTNYTFKNLSEGSYNLSVKIIDNAGNYHIYSTRIIVDLTPPQLTISHPLEEEFLNSSSINVNWGITEKNGLSALKIKIDNGAWANLSLNARNYEFNVNDGRHRITIMAVDLAGNEVVKSVNFTVDTVAPTLYFTSPSNNTWLNKSTVNIEWACSDTWGISKMMIRMDNHSWKELQAKVRSYSLNIPEGKHSIEILAMDQAKNIAEIKETIGVDYEIPIVKINLEKNYISINASDNISGIKAIIYSIDGGSWEHYDGKINMKDLSAGTHNISVIVEDYAGNKVYVNKTFENREMQYSTYNGGNNLMLLLALIGIIIALAIAMFIMAVHYREEIRRLKEISQGTTEEKTEPQEESKEEKENQNNSP